MLIWLLDIEVRSYRCQCLSRSQPNVALSPQTCMCRFQQAGSGGRAALHECQLNRARTIHFTTPLSYITGHILHYWSRQHRINVKVRYDRHQRLAIRITLSHCTPISQDLLYCSRAFMISALIDSGFVVDAQRALTFPSLPIKNFSKFH